MTRIPMLVVLAAALLVAAPVAAAVEAAKPEYREENDRLVILNDLVTLTFEGKRPRVAAFPTANESAAWTFEAKRLVEYFDEDGDGVVDPGESRAVLNLTSQAPWMIEHHVDEGTVELALTFVGRLALESPAGELPLDLPTAAPTGNVTLRFVLAAAATDVDLANGTTVVPATAARMDVVVNAWSFIDTRDKLAFVADVADDLERVESGVLEATAVVSGGARLGYLSWAREARTTHGGENATVAVRSHIAPAANATRVFWTYDAPGAAPITHVATLSVVAASPVATGGPEPDVLGGLRTPGAGTLATVAVAMGAIGVASFARRP